MLLRQKKTIAPEVLWENIAHFAKLVKSALGEMRILLLELRPESLNSAELPSLLTHLVDAAGSRLDANIQLEIQGKAELPVEAKIAFYRIAQEALNNIIKHARCHTVSIQFISEVRLAKLIIADDGIGLASGEKKGTQMGVTIMRERAGEIGATLEILSQPGKGTRITCLWQPDGSAA
jgi:signal transduction histidine kinase